MHIVQYIFLYYYPHENNFVSCRYLMLDVGDAAGGPLFLVVRPAGRAQNQAAALNACLPLAPAQLDGGAMTHSLRRSVP
jgi:hypothetical protein